MYRIAVCLFTLLLGVVGAAHAGVSVSPSGAVTYSIPIEAPPGVNRMTPKLSLNHNSQGGNGLLGMGWAIGGASARTTLLPVK